MNQNMLAKGQSLQDLIAAMNDDDAKKIPGVTIIVAGGQSEPQGNEVPGQGPGSEDMSLGGTGDYEDDPFQALLKKKKQEIPEPEF